MTQAYLETSEMNVGHESQGGPPISTSFQHPLHSSAYGSFTNWSLNLPLTIFQRPYVSPVN